MYSLSFVSRCPRIYVYIMYYYFIRVRARGDFVNEDAHAQQSPPPSLNVYTTELSTHARRVRIITMTYRVSLKVLMS